MHEKSALDLLRDNYPLLVIFLLGLGLRIHRLGAESIWFDEAVSVAASKLGFIEQIRWNLTASDNNPPLYYALLHVWVLIFGVSELALRLPSAIIGSFNILLVYAVGNMLFNKKTGLLAALILALSVFHIQFSQEGRAYSLSAFLTLLSYYFFLKSVAERKRVNSIGYIVSSVLLMYSHYYGLFVILSQNIYCAWQYTTHRKSGALDIKKWIALQAILGILYLPGLYFLYCHTIGIQKGFWLTAPTLKVILDCFDLYTGSTILLVILTLLSLYSVMGIGGVGLKLFPGRLSGQSQNRTEPRGLSYSNAVVLLLVWLFTPIAVPF
ncbi:MAG: glycosyltransferase family 39 protein [Thermodesulfobacteriota bacterium]